MQTGAAAAANQSGSRAFSMFQRNMACNRTGKSEGRDLGLAYDDDDVLWTIVRDDVPTLLGQLRALKADSK